MLRLRPEQQNALRKAGIARGICKLIQRDGTLAEYDPGKSLISARDPLNRATAYQLDECGFISKVTTPAGRKTRFLNDQDGKLHAFREPSGHTTSFTFTSDSKLSSLSYDAIKLCEFSSNEAERRTVAKFWDGSQSQLTLNEAGGYRLCRSDSARWQRRRPQADQS